VFVTHIIFNPASPDVNMSSSAVSSKAGSFSGCSDGEEIPVPADADRSGADGRGGGAAFTELVFSKLLEF